MEFTNLNFLSVLIFFLSIFIIFFIFYKRFLTEKQILKKISWLAYKNKLFYLKFIFLFLSLFIILFWIFWIKFWEKIVKTKSKWIDVMFVLDVSKSMNVADIRDSNYSYTRLDVAKEAIWNYVVNHKQDRFWLIIFAWDAISTIPLTTDHDLFLTFLKWVDYRNLVKQWSNFTKALKMWTRRFIWDKDRSKALVFISDWWDKDDFVDVNSIKSLKRDDISYVVVWVWTEKWWRIITWRSVFWDIKYQKYKWKYVISKLNKNALEKIAKSLDANFLIIKKAWDLMRINNFLKKLEKKVFLKNNNKELMNFWRSLTIFSLIFFLFFLFFYLFENKLFFNKNINE